MGSAGLSPASASWSEVQHLGSRFVISVQAHLSS